MISSMISQLLFFTLSIFIIGNHPSDGGIVSGSEFQPEFAQPLENVTVPLGRDATFTCVVKDLGGYRVGWVRADSKAIQAIHTHVITHNPRISVSHSDHSTWHLHVKGVKEEDRGSFMCQVNTDPMIFQVSYLEVVIPPDFITEETSSDLMAPEGSTVKLNCNARGHPTPNITWRRENDANITLKTSVGSKIQVSTFEGNVLRLSKVSRADMGPYLCIASNGIPPAISKRIILSVHFFPVIHVPNQLIGAPLNTDVILECNVEAYPRSIHFWIKDKGGMIITGERHDVQETTKSMFEVKMVLIIRNFQPEDTGRYSCIAKNSIGDVESIIKLHELKVLEENSGRLKIPNSVFAKIDYKDEDEEDEDLELGTSNPIPGNDKINPGYINGYTRNIPSKVRNGNNKKSSQHYSSTGSSKVGKHGHSTAILIRPSPEDNGRRRGEEMSTTTTTTTSSQASPVNNGDGWVQRIVWGLLFFAINYHYSNT